MTSDTEMLSEGEHEDLVDELRLACDTGDLQKISAFLALSTPALTADDLLQSLRFSLDDLAIARCLLEHGADAKNVDYGSIRKALQESKSMKPLELLQEFGYDVRPDGHHFLALYADSRTELDWLLDQGVDINGTRVPKNTDLEEWSIEILDDTAAAGDIELMNHLVSRGACPSQSLALHSATKCKDPDKTRKMIACLITKHGMNVDAYSEDFRSYFHQEPGSGTPLSTAIYEHNAAAVQELLERGANPKGRYTLPLGDAIGNHFCDAFTPAIKPLLEAGESASEGLNLAVARNNLEAASIFLDWGADPIADGLKDRHVVDEIEMETEESDEVTEEMLALLNAWRDFRNGEDIPGHVRHIAGKGKRGIYEGDD